MHEGLKTEAEGLGNQRSSAQGLALHVQRPMDSDGHRQEKKGSLAPEEREQIWFSLPFFFPHPKIRVWAVVGGEGGNRVTL